MTTLIVREPRSPVDLAGEPIQEWMQVDGTIWATCHRAPSGYVMRFPDIADFEISRDARSVVCYPTAATEDHVITHLYLNQVLPMAVGRQGGLAFHGSAIEIGSQAAVFMGESGRGKSTLAFSFATNGIRFLTDDGLLIDDTDGNISVAPSHPSIRLWQDSQQALKPSGADVTTALAYTSKSRINADGTVLFCDQPRPISKVYFLGEGNVDAIELEPISPADALIRWVQNSFMLDVEDQDFVAAHFDRVSNLVAKIPCYTLDYPRRFDDLSGVRQAITRHATA